MPNFIIIRAWWTALKYNQISFLLKLKASISTQSTETNNSQCWPKSKKFLFIRTFSGWVRFALLFLARKPQRQKYVSLRCWLLLSSHLAKILLVATFPPHLPSTTTICWPLARVKGRARPRAGAEAKKNCKFLWRLLSARS